MVKIFKDRSNIDNDYRELKEELEKRKWKCGGRWFHKKGVLLFPSNPYSLIRISINGKYKEILIPTENIPLKDFIEILEAFVELNNFCKNVINEEW